MTEIYQDIREEVKELARIAWTIAITQKTPAAAAKILDNITNYYSNFLSDEEKDFLQFYFNTQMEMKKE